MEPRRFGPAGRQVEYLVRPAATPQPRAPVLLVPGMLASAASWLDYPALLAHLTAEQGRAVFAISLRGRGGSSLPERGFDLAHHTQDLLALLDYALLERVVVVGWSIGAVYGLGLASAHPDRVLGLIVGDAAPCLPKFGERWRANAETLRSELPFHPELPGRIVAEAERESLETTLPGLALPILVLRGTLDDALLKSDSAAASWLAAPNSTIVPLACGHEVFAEPEGQMACLRFLEQLG